MSMPVIDLKVDGDDAWTDTQLSEIIDCGTTIKMAGLRGGMGSGKPSVAIRLDLPDGRAAIAQTSLAMLETVTRALIARYGSQVLP
jgi:hypothetical protein